MTVSRRQMLAGLGAASAAGALAVTLPSAGAATLKADDGFGGGGTDALSPAGAGLGALALTPGLTYLTTDPTAFGPVTSTQGRSMSASTGASLITPTGGLMAPLFLPAGAVLKEVLFAYASPAGAATLGVWKKTLTGPYEIQNNPPAGLALPNGAAVLTAALTFDETVDGDSTYMLLMNNITTTAQSVHGLVIGYTPPAQAFVAVNPVARVLDTRVAGGKLGPNEERTVPLHTPAFAKAAVINLTITETENSGFVAVFRADQPWPGNSSINWSTSDQNLANGVITATDATGAIKVRGGVNRTQVVIDVQGYLL
jgi:hypothetical protein